MNQSPNGSSAPTDLQAVLIVLLGIAIVIGVSIVINFKGRVIASPVGQGFSVRAVDALPDGTSVAIIADPTSHYWLAHLGQDGDPAWVKPLPGIPQQVRDEFAWSTNRTAVFVRLVRSSGDIVDVHAFALTSGATLWTTKIVSSSELYGNWELEDVARGRFSLEATNEVIAATRRSNTDLAILDAATGRVLSPFEGVSDLRSPQFLGEQIVVMGGLGTLEGGLTIIGRSGRQQDAADLVCGTGLDAVTVENTNSEPRIRSIGDHGEGAVLRGFSEFIERCAQYRDRFVGLTTGYRDELHVVMFDRAGTLLHDIRLGARFLRGEPLQNQPSAPLSGEVTRFVPLIIDAGDESQLVMLDLEEGKIAWRSTPQHHLDSSVLFASAGSWYWIDGIYGRGVIARFDGDTGLLEVALEHIAGGGGLQEINASDVAGSTIWLRGHQTRDFGRLPIAALDSDTLMPRGSTELEFRDTTAHVAEWLGAPRDAQRSAQSPR